MDSAKLFHCDFWQSGGLISLEGDQLAIGWGAQSWQAEPSPQSPFSFYFPDFFLADQKPWLTFEHHRIVTIAELAQALPTFLPPSSLGWSPADKQSFAEQCADLSEEIGAGKVQKGVPYAFERCEGFKPAHIQACLASSLKMASHFPLFLYGFWNEREGMLGATPEHLFKQEQYDEWRVDTWAIAGTVETDHTHWEGDPKLKQEHEIVVRGIEESLSPYGKVIREGTSLLPYSHLAHISTPLTLSRQTSLPFETLVQALHPTAALGAYPKKEGQQWLLKMQQRCDRRRYGAPAGWKRGGSDEGHCLVAIRNVQWREGSAMLGAGCGFVKESHVDQEWAELQKKLKAMKEILHL
ncbi:MAG: chorismate-binding protein [Parachlamydia sp.]|nr:chorismate-binding protein [Parachlamydia sp.]